MMLFEEWPTFHGLRDRTAEQAQDGGRDVDQGEPIVGGDKRLIGQHHEAGLARVLGKMAVIAAVPGPPQAREIGRAHV